MNTDIEKEEIKKSHLPKQLLNIKDNFLDYCDEIKNSLTPQFKLNVKV